MAPDPQSREARQQRFAHFTELAIVSVQEIVDFAKQVPGFLQLGREDQIALLKASTIEVTASLPSLREAVPSCSRRSPEINPRRDVRSIGTKQTLGLALVGVVFSRRTLKC